MIKPLRLARVAARAEVLVLQREVAGIARRAAYGVVAAIFALAALTLIHVLIYLALRQYVALAQLPAAAIVFGLDGVLALIFGLLASGRKTDPALEEAKRLRDQSLEQARQSLTLAGMVAPVTRIASDTGMVRLLVRLVGSLFRRSARG